jgi:hypothetical protein
MVTTAANTAATAAAIMSGSRRAAVRTTARTGAPRNRVRNAGLTITTLMRFITRTKVLSGRPCSAGITATTNAT